jgi:putative glutamine amidotransferase
VIGITTRIRTVTASFGAQPMYTLSCHYPVAVRDAGATPLLLVPVPEADVVDVVDRIDALMLTGGGDVGVDLYGGVDHPDLYDVDDERDRFELELVRLARERRMPVLGICRGTQMLNVALGGDLLVDVDTHVAEALSHRSTTADIATHPVRLKPGSRASALFGSDEVEVNSYHHQALGRLAPGLQATGWADDGVIEVVEGDDDAWPVFGVQWHPEHPTPDGPARCRPFEALVTAARRWSEQADERYRGEGGLRDAG